MTSSAQDLCTRSCLVSLVWCVPLAIAPKVRRMVPTGWATRASDALRYKAVAGTSSPGRRSGIFQGGECLEILAREFPIDVPL